MTPRITLILIFIATFFQLNAQYHSLKKEARGIWLRTDIENEDLLQDSLLVGVAIDFRWKDIHKSKEAGINFDTIQNLIDLAVSYEKSIYFRIFIGPDSPDWLWTDPDLPCPYFDTDSDKNEKKGWIHYPDYKSDEYRHYLDEYLNDFSNFLFGQDANTLKYLEFVQVTMGATGDDTPYKGEITTNGYTFTDDDWFDYKKYLIGRYTYHFQQKNNKKLRLLFNGLYNTPDDELFQFVKQTVENPGFKNSGMGRGFHLTKEREKNDEWKAHLIDVQNPADEFFTRSEMDQTWEKDKYQLNVPLNNYWAVLTALEGGLSVWDVNADFIVEGNNDPGVRMGFEFFSKYAAEIYPESAEHTYSIFHDGLDSEDTLRFPEDEYGKASGNELSRFKAIVEDRTYSKRGALLEDTKAVVEGQVKQREIQKKFNDTGWMIHAGNYERFLYQVNPNETSVGVFRINEDADLGKTIDANSPVYARFGRQIDADTDFDRMDFRFHEDYFETNKTEDLTFEFKITWLDHNKRGTWKFKYDDGSGSLKTAKTFTGNNDGWRTDVITIDDASFTQSYSDNKTQPNIDFTIEMTEGDYIFHGIEAYSKKVQFVDPVIPPNDTTVCLNSDVNLVLQNADSAYWNDSHFGTSYSFNVSLAQNDISIKYYTQGREFTTSVSVTGIQAQINSVEISNPTCEGVSNGEITVDASSDQTPLTFTLNGESGSSPFTELTAGEYTIIVTDALGCSDTSATTLSNETVFEFDIEDASILENDSVTIELDAANSYLWDDNSTAKERQFKGANLGVGTHEFTVVAENESGCTASSTFEIEVVPLNNVTVSNDTTVCLYDEIELSVSGADSAIWKSSSKGNTYTLVVAENENIVNLTYYSQGKQYQTTITVNGVAPVIDEVVTNNPTCEGADDGSLIINASGDQIPFSYSVNDEESDSKNWTNLAKGNFNVIVTDAMGCSDTSEASLENKSEFEYAINDQSIASSETAVVDLDPSHTYLWEDNNTSAIRSFSGLELGIGEHEFTVEVTNEFGCSTTSTFTIEVLPSKNIVISNDTTVCMYETVELEVTGADRVIWNDDHEGNTYEVTANTAETTVEITYYSGGQAYESSVVVSGSKPEITDVITSQPICEGASDGEIYILVENSNTPTSYHVNGETSSNAKWTELIAGNYEIIVSDALGCSDSSDVVLENKTVFKYPISNQSIVSNETAIVELDESNTYLWDDNNTSAIRSFSGLELGIGEHEFTVEVTNEFGCSTTSTFTIEVLPSKNIVISNDTTVCMHETVSLSVSGADRVIWNNTYEGNAYEVKASDSKTTVNVTYYSNGTPYESTVNVFGSAPVIKDIISSNPMCDGAQNGEVYIVVENDNTPTTYWLNDTPSQNAKWEDLAEGNYQIVIEDAHGCKDTSEVELENITVFEYEIEDVIVSENEVVTIELDSTNTYAWSDNYKGHSRDFDGTTMEIGKHWYTVQVTNEYGCSSLSTFSVTVSPVTSIQENEMSFSVYPNPSTGVFNLETSFEGVYRIFNLTGSKMLQTGQFGVNVSTINIENLTRGVYLLQITGSDYNATVKLMVH